LRYVLRRQTWSPFTPEPVEFATLNYDFHPKQVRQWLDQAGFTVERQLTVSHFRIGMMKRLVPIGLLAAADSLAQLSGNLWQLTPSVFVLAKAAGDSSPPASDYLFRCLNCGNTPLEETEDIVLCSLCSASWPIKDGIYDFR
jgi:hypothetical protein